MTREKYESLPLNTLKALAKSRNMKGISALRKEALIERMLEEDQKENRKEDPKENQREDQKESQKEDLKESRKENPKDLKEIPKENPKSRYVRR